MKDEIEKWLAGNKDFSTGRALYLKYGNNVNLKNLFTKKGRTHYNQAKLESELATIAGRPESGLTGRSNQQTGPAQTLITQFHKIQQEDLIQLDYKKFSGPKRPYVDFNSLPEELKSEFIKMGDCTRKRSFLHAQLEFLSSDDKRKESAEAIEKLSETIDAVWKKLDYWTEHKKLPEDAKPKINIEITDDVELLKHRNNLRSQISKLKKKPGSEGKISAITSEINAINLKLNEPVQS